MERADQGDITLTNANIKKMCTTGEANVTQVPINIPVNVTKTKTTIKPKTSASAIHPSKVIHLPGPFPKTILIPTNNSKPPIPTKLTLISIQTIDMAQKSTLRV
jgi:hypothetical protein